MWWLYRLIEENNERALYGYSRETDKTDGIIEYDKNTGIAILVRPCESDTGDEWNSEYSLSRFVRFVVNEGLPSIRRVVIG